MKIDVLNVTCGKNGFKGKIAFLVLTNDKDLTTNVQFLVNRRGEIGLFRGPIHHITATLAYQGCVPHRKDHHPSASPTSSAFLPIFVSIGI